MNKSSKCRIYCKDLSYDYIYDDYGHIISTNSDIVYKCLKYNKILGNKANKCEECINSYKKKV